MSVTTSVLRSPNRRQPYAAAFAQVWLSQPGPSSRSQEEVHASPALQFAQAV